MYNRYFIVVNIISFSRIFISLLFLFFFTNENIVLQQISLLLLFIIIITDVADGYIARKKQVETKFGYILDGLGDRAFYLAIILAVTLRYSLSWEITYLIILRDILLYGIRSYFPNWYTTTLKLRFITKTYGFLIRFITISYLLISYNEIFHIYFITSNIKAFLINSLEILFYSFFVFSYASLAALLYSYAKNSTIKFDE